MGKLIPVRADLRVKLHDVVHHGRQWFHKWDPYLDRVEEFASNLGVDYAHRVGGYARRLDTGLVAMGAGLIALVALALGQ